jgi:hypothetical protein
MTTIYLVTGGDYSDYSVLGAFSTRELADAAIAEGIGDQVEEMVVDPKMEPKPPGLEPFGVTISNDGDSCVARKESPYGWHKDDGSFPLRWPAPGQVAEHGTNEKEYYHRNFQVWAADEQSATIAVLNHRAAMITAGKWPHVDKPEPPRPGISMLIGPGDLLHDGTDSFLEHSRKLGATLGRG